MVRIFVWDAGQIVGIGTWGRMSAIDLWCARHTAVVVVLILVRVEEVPRERRKTKWRGSNSVFRLAYHQRMKRCNVDIWSALSYAWGSLLRSGATWKDWTVHHELTGKAFQTGRDRRRRRTRSCSVIRSAEWRMRWLVDMETIVMTTGLFERKIWVIDNSTVTAIRRNTNVWRRFGSSSARWGLWRCRKGSRDVFLFIVLICERAGALAVTTSCDWSVSNRMEFTGLNSTNQSPHVFWPARKIGRLENQCGVSVPKEPGFIRRRKG